MLLKRFWAQYRERRHRRVNSWFMSMPLDTWTPPGVSSIGKPPRYPEKLEGLLALDLQLACYSWLTGEPEVAFVVFVRKRLPEIQYLRSSITEEQRREFGQLVEDTVAQIEAAQFLPRPGIRFPQNGCTSCPYLGLCLQNQPLIDAKLLRRPGGDFGWLDELEH